MTDRLHGTGANGVRRRNRRAEITTRWLEAREGRSFACAMHADQGLEEESVGQLLSPEGSTREPRASARRPFESRVRPSPGPRSARGRITGLECALRGLHDWAIQAVTVCERAGRRERKESEPYCHRYQPNVGDAHDAPPEGR